MNLVIVSHGLTLRVFLMRWYKWTVEQFEGLNNFGNGKMIVMEKGYGGRYSLLVHHSEEELRKFGLTDDMLTDQDCELLEYENNLVGEQVQDTDGIEFNDEGCFSVVHAEYLALLAALDWTVSVGLSLHFDGSDCLAIVNAFSNRSSFLNELGSLLEDLASLMSNFLGVSLIHVRRTANGLHMD
uniref:RNase H type-1 domain-containing protein n=1 Tax=Cannabis sativa TaxID=3483 RepID=A0A803PJU3_CANSA